MKTKAVYAGTFDPLTRGHFDLIVKGVELFDELIVGIGVNPGKSPLFNAQERKAIINESICEHMLLNQHNIHLVARLGSIKIEVIENEYLVNFAEQNNVQYILRGLRDSEDFRQEQAYRFFNKSIAPNVEAVYLMPNPEYANVSSSAIKSMIGPTGWQNHIKPFLTTAAYKAILKKKGDQ